MKAIATFAFVFGFAALVWAASPHFIAAKAIINDDGSLTASFKESGLGFTTLIEYELTSVSTTYYDCTAGGEADDLSSFVMFTSTKNGKIAGSLTLEPSPPVVGCPSGQTPRMLRVHYGDVTLHDISNNTSAVLGDFLRTFYVP